jgi:hypothetical protein
VIDRGPLDVLPGGVIRMILVTAQERDVRDGVLNGEDIAKWLRFEEAESKSDVQEFTSESVQGGVKSRTCAEREQPFINLKRLERTNREHAQEMRGDGTSVKVLRGHVYLQGLDKAQRSRRRKRQIVYPLLLVDSVRDSLEKVHLRAIGPRSCHQSAVLESFIDDDAPFRNVTFLGLEGLEGWSVDPSATYPNVIDDHVDQLLRNRVRHHGKGAVRIVDVG